MPGTYQYDVEIKSNVAKLLSDMKQVQDRLDTVEGKEYKIKLNVDEKKLSSVISNLEKMLDSLGKGTGDFKQFENLSKELSSIVSEVQSLSKAFGKVDDSGAKTLLSSIQNIDKSLSELSQNILNVNKNMSNMGGNTSGAVKQVENITNESKKAASALEDVAKAQEKVNGQKTNISSDISSQVKVSNGITDQIVANEKKKQEAYKATTETVMYHAGVISKLNKAETNGRFYGSDRGTGYFGTGHYFVDSNTKHELDNNSSYSSLPYTSIDISKYDNLFKATSDEVADALHTFLKSLTKFTQGSDSFEVSELFSQFQKVFGETTMDMQEFDAKLSQLKAYMQSSNMSDRGDSVSTQFMKSLGYGGVDTRGTKYADTRYGTVIYDLKEESVLQANITDELQKQGQMLEKITYEKGQVFDKSEDTRIQGILDQQAKAKEIETEFNKIFDSTNLNTYNSELDSVNQKLTENESIINNCKSAIETADEDAKRFAKEMAEFDLHMSDEEIAETANKNKVEYQERIEELSKEQSLLKDRKQEIESNLDAEYKLANAARERATATVEDRMKDAFPKTSENLEQVAQSEQKVQQEAVAIDKAFDNISFTPNTEGFEDIIAKFGILREQAEQITKIVKTTKQTADGTPNISYKATLKNGSSYYLGENSTPQVLNASETVYDAKVDNAKKLEREKQIWNELTNSLERYATIQKRIASLDDALVDLKKTTAMSKTQLEDFYYDANDVAKQMGVTTEEIITQASAWSRLGYSSQEAATTMAKLSSKFASISPGMSTDEAQEGLVSIMKAFDIDPDDVETEIMDKVNVLGNKFAEENQDVIEGLKRSAAAMSAMGQSFTDTAALFTGGMEILQDSESMGTALRTLSMRVRGYDEETNQLSDDLVNVTGEVADLTKTAQDSQGVSLFTDATQEHYRSMVEYLGDIADRWDQISEKNQTELLQKLFGKNRANAGAAIIQNFDQVRAAIEAMDESAGSSEAEMSAIESSLSYKINALKETWVGCVQDMIDRGDLGTIVTGLTKVSEAITFLLDKFGILGTIGLGAGIFSGIKNVGRDKMYSLSF